MKGRKSLIIIGCCLLLVAVFLYGPVLKQEKDTESTYQQLQKENTAAASSEDTVSDNSDWIDELAATYPCIDVTPIDSENYIGWIYVPNTNISYPIMQGDDNKYYLKHDYAGKRSAAGSIFLDYRSNDVTDSHAIIYGHNMMYGSMFSRLKDYVNVRGYAAEHPAFWIIQPDGKKILYGVFAADCPRKDNKYIYTIIRTVGTDEADESRMFFADILKFMQRRTIYDYGLDVTPDDSTVTLSVCMRNRVDRSAVTGKILRIYE